MCQVKSKPHVCQRGASEASLGWGTRRNKLNIIELHIQENRDKSSEKVCKILTNPNLCSGFIQHHSEKNKVDSKPYITITLSEIAYPEIGQLAKNPQQIAKDRLEAGGVILDRATERAGQLCYLPNLGDFYRYHVERYSGPLDSYDAVFTEHQRIANGGNRAHIKIGDKRYDQNCSIFDNLADVGRKAKVGGLI